MPLVILWILLSCSFMVTATVKDDSFKISIENKIKKNDSINLREIVLIECQTQKRVIANFTWSIRQKIYHVHKDKQAPEIYRKEDRGIKSVFTKMFEEPGEFEIFCNATNSKNVTRSKMLLVKIEDVCGLPPRHTVTSLNYQCTLKFTNLKEFAEQCRVLEPKRLEVKDVVDEQGEQTVVIRWETYKQKDIKRIGFKLTRNFEKSTIYEDYTREVCVITKYMEGQKVRANTSIYKGNNIFEGNLKDLNLPIVETALVSISIQSLPSSRTLTKVIPIRKKSVLCQEYANEHGAVPKYCFVFGNITLLKVSTDCKTKRMRVRLRWNTKDVSSWNDEHLNTTHILVLSYGNNFFHNNVTSYVWDLPLESSFTFTFLRFKGKDGWDQVYTEAFTIDTITYDCLSTTIKTTSLNIKSTNPALLSLGLILAAIFLTSCFILFIIQYWYKRVKSDMRPLFVFQQSMSVEEEVEETNLEEVKERNVPKVSIVYPHGCNEVENMVLFLISQLRTFGVEVLCDILEAERVAKYGLPTVLMDNFNIADYVVVLCLDEKISEESVKSFQVHQPYLFVQKMMSNSCFLSNDKRFLAIYFDKKTCIPGYLNASAYYLPTRFSSFVQSIFGVQTFFSYLYDKIFEQNVPHAIERKAQLQQLTEKLNSTAHVSCFQDTCRKGTLSTSSSSDQVEVVLKFPDDEDSDDDEIEENNISPRNDENAELLLHG